MAETDSSDGFDGETPDGYPPHNLQSVLPTRYVCSSWWFPRSVGSLRDYDPPQPNPPTPG